MRPLWKDVLVAVWLGMVVPGIVLNAIVLKEKSLKRYEPQTVNAETVADKGQAVAVLSPDGQTLEMDLDDYLTGVLLAEMPAEFHPEALKAQSVAARTFAWKAHTSGGKHKDGSICMDPVCCQAYIGEESYLSRGGSEENLNKVSQAVRATSGFVLVFEGELIEATYFSSTGGSTEAAVEVWGADYPYLQAVSSPETMQPDTVVFTKEEFQKRLGRKLTQCPEEWFGAVTYTEGDGVASMEICAETYRGVELRHLLGLRSTAFEVQTEDNDILITTRGYGHRVGMSQYGAHAMAEAGSTWQEILQHYYPGTNLVPIS